MKSHTVLFIHSLLSRCVQTQQGREAAKQCMPHGDPEDFTEDDLNGIGCLIGYMGRVDLYKLDAEPCVITMNNWTVNGRYD